MIPERFAHLLFAIGASEEGGDENDLGGLARLALEVASHEVIEELIVATELDVGLDGDRVVALEDGVLKFGQADGDALLVAFGEVVPFEQAGDVDLAVEAEEIGAGEFGQPLAVTANFGFLGVDDLEDLVGVGFGVLLDHFGFEGGAGFGAAGGVADSGGVVAHDDDGKVAGLLELANFGQDEGVAKVEIGGGGVETKFDTERAAEGEFFGELFPGMDVGQTRKKEFNGHGGRVIGFGEKMKSKIIFDLSRFESDL